MTTAQVAETSVTANNSPVQDYVHRDDHTQPTSQVAQAHYESREKHYPT